MTNGANTERHTASGQATGADGETRRVGQHIRRADPFGRRFDRVFRLAYDQVYDGQHTGRFSWDQLFKTEQRLFSLLVAAHVQREFGFPDGDVLDISVVDVDAACLFSETPEAWRFPAAAAGQVCLLLAASDHNSVFSVGVTRAPRAGAPDDTGTIVPGSSLNVSWVHQDQPLTTNLLLHLADDDRAAILDAHQGTRNGQRRVDALFEHVQGRLVSRATLAAVAQQEDYMKRVRDNQGARGHLRPKGIVILGDYAAHRQVARDLGLPEPRDGGFVSIRLAPAIAGDGEPSTRIGAEAWRVARPDDPVVSAPQIPLRVSG